MGAVSRTQAVLLCVFLLLVHGLSCSKVLVDPKTQAVTGHSVTLSCRFTGSAQVTQVTWDKLTELGTHMVAIRSREHGSSTHPFYGSRARFRSAASDPDASLLIQDVILADAGRFRCKILTFPSGSFEKDTWLTVQVPPQVSVVPGPRALLEGDRRALAATCTATASSPRANVSWDTQAPGEQEETVWDNANSTVTVSVRYYLDPVRAMRGQRLDCLVTHSTFAKPARLRHQLNVYYVPEVSVSASANWLVGTEGAELDCAENGNPPATAFEWKRLDGPLPNNSVTEGNKLTFKGSLTLQDSGVYVCDVTNEIGTRSAQLEVNVTDKEASGVNMLSMAFVAIGAVGLILLVFLVISVIAMNRYHHKKTEEMVFKLEEFSTMSRQPSLRRCNSVSVSTEARLHDGGGSRENELEQDLMLMPVAAQEQRSGSRELLSATGDVPRPPPALGNHRYSLRSTASERPASPACTFGAYRGSLREAAFTRSDGPLQNESQRHSVRDLTPLPTPIAPGNPRGNAQEVTVTSDRVESLTSRTLTASPSTSESQTEDEEETADRQQSIHTAMGHFYSHNGTLRPKSNGSKVYIARREHCV